MSTQLATNVADIYYSQPTISAVMNQCKLSIFQTMYAYRKGLMDPNDLPPIRLRLHKGRTYSIDNRRLWMFKQLSLSKVTVDDTNPEELFKKLAGGGDGINVKIREACPTCLQLFEEGEGEGGRKRFSGALDHHIKRAHMWPQSAVPRSLPALVCPKHGRVSLRWTGCSNKRKCKISLCSNKYPCKKAHARLSCGCGRIERTKQPTDLSLQELVAARWEVMTHLVPTSL